MRSSRLVAVLVSVIVLLLSGCAGSTPPTTAAGADETIDDETSDDNDVDAATVDDGSPALSFDVDDVDGTSWTLLFGGGPEGDIAMVDGWPVTLAFDGSNLGGTAACNGYGASYRIDGSEFQVNELGQNQMDCQPEVQEVERRYLLALQDVDGINVIGEELALSGPATELIFRRNDAAPLDDVTATMWLLEALLQDGVETPVAGDPATLLVESASSQAGSLIGTTGCRTLVGAFRASGNQVFLNDFSANGDCPTSLRAQDSSVVSVLGDGFVPEVNGGELILTSPGNQGLRYRATTEDEVAALPASTAPTDAELLAGVEWVFTGGSGPSELIADPRSVSEQQITFVVRDGTFSGMVNCNSYGGQVEIGAGQWSLTAPDATAEGCGLELDAIAASYLAALPLMSEFGIEGGGTRLTTNGSDIELSFERAQ